MVSFRYTSILFYTFLCFSAGTSKGAVDSQNQTILARVRRADDQPTIPDGDTAVIVTKINGFRDTYADNAKDMTHVAYSKCLAEIAADLIKGCDGTKSPTPDKYGKTKKVDAIFFNKAKTDTDALSAIIGTDLGAVAALTTPFTCAKGDTCMPLAKVINSGSYEVGCAVKVCATYKPTTGSDAVDQKAFACVLGPGMFEGGAAPFTVVGAATDKCKGCKNAECKTGSDNICNNPKDFVATADKCPAPKKTEDDSGDDKKGDKKTSGKKKSMGVQSVKPQTVLAVAVTAILSLFLAH